MALTPSLPNKGKSSDHAHKSKQTNKHKKHTTKRKQKQNRGVEAVVLCTPSPMEATCAHRTVSRDSKTGEIRIKLEKQTFINSLFLT